MKLISCGGNPLYYMNVYQGKKRPIKVLVRRNWNGSMWICFLCSGGCDECLLPKNLMFKCLTDNEVIISSTELAIALGYSNNKGNTLRNWLKRNKEWTGMEEEYKCGLT